MLNDAEVISQLADQKEPPPGASFRVGVPDLWTTVTAVADLQSEYGTLQEQPDAELPSWRHSVEQGIGGEF